MNYTVGSTGRVVVARLSSGEAIYPAIETIARNESIASGVVWIIGGIQNGGIVAGPKDQNAEPLETIIESFVDAREILGIGTLFLNEGGQPSLHMHAAIGKGTTPLVGCPRKGADCWLVDEVVILELTGVAARRVRQSCSGFELLELE